ncbi:unnamed protein product [Parnassius mnemosyne]|uniref:DUF4773 domain-containing protein n=1 Tax=Parnassius mnemosyne TaxID=213953 RepID=A0AAV1M229_9NEOP
MNEASTTEEEVCSGDVIVSKDREYEVIHFKVPNAIWKQALDPTPILKSPVTIVLPIHVPQDDDNEVLEEEVEDEIQETVEDVTPANVNDEVVIQDVTQNPVTTISSVSQGPIEENVVNDTPGEQVNGQVVRFPCNCVKRQCGCCTGSILERFSMKACGNITFVPEDFIFDVKLSVNNNTVVRRRVSASDPPPICFNPRRAPFVRVCAEISDIRVRNGNAFACMDINADIAGFPIYSASFRCFGFGKSGVQTGLKPKPISSGPKPVNLFGNGNNEDSGGFLENAAGTLLGNGNSGGDSMKNATHSNELKGLEVPESQLLISRFNLKKLAIADQYSRQNQESTEEDTILRRPCLCSLGVCKCCTGLILDLFNQKACMKITYHPGDFAFDVAMSMNDRVLYENSLSGKNPRPVCISPPRMPNLKVCARFYNIFFPGRNFHFCLAMNGQWRSVELFNLAFDCLRMGANGIAMVKPDEGGGLPIPNPHGGVDAVIDAGEDDIEEYDDSLVRSLFDVLED